MLKGNVTNKGQNSGPWSLTRTPSTHPCRLPVPCPDFPNSSLMLGYSECSKKQDKVCRDLTKGMPVREEGSRGWESYEGEREGGKGVGSRKHPGPPGSKGMFSKTIPLWGDS